MRVLLTGAHGFLGWHTRARLHALTDHEVVPVGRANWPAIGALLADVDAVIHVAGVNRGDAKETCETNVALGRELAAAVRSVPRPPRLVYANSTQADNDSPYGRGKREAGSILADALADRNAPFTDVRLPNLFGEHGRPDYNSFVATFVDRLIHGSSPSIQDNRVDLLHAQAAAQILIDALAGSTQGVISPQGSPTTVLSVWRTLASLFGVYRHGEIPTLTNAYEVNLLNTLRAAMFEKQNIALTRRSDARGSLVETVRAHGSQGQTFISTTKPGITRGEHFHLRKLERFVVIGGSAEIAVRRLYTNDVRRFHVNGDTPVAVDMPIGWAHKITNTGIGTLTTMFWTSELFDPEDTDTYPEEV
ncbi:NAD-dependent epimerase/dehydratase family protein [Georgenia sp. MJ206]|uniref:polysaccharide biosynthesis C-terminal domain-containing protein n=1 Tax=Georgenia wangjunii TaxID=3117730 RepID=UPI002F266C8A